MQPMQRREESKMKTIKIIKETARKIGERVISVDDQDSIKILKTPGNGPVAPMPFAAIGGFFLTKTTKSLKDLPRRLIIFLRLDYCPQCAGDGWDADCGGPYICPTCGGKGLVPELKNIYRWECQSCGTVNPYRLKDCTTCGFHKYWSG